MSPLQCRYCIHRRSLPADAYEQLKRRLCDLLQRNREFRALLLAGDVRPTPVGGLTFGTLATDEPLDAFPSPGKFFDMVRASFFVIDNNYYNSIKCCLWTFKGYSIVGGIVLW